MEAVVLQLKPMSNLNSFTMEVFGIDDLPANINNLKQLNKLHLLQLAVSDPELENLNDEFLKKMIKSIIKIRIAKIYTIFITSYINDENFPD